MRSGDRPGLQNRRVAGNPVTGGFDPHSLPPVFNTLQTRKSLANQFGFGRAICTTFCSLPLIQIKATEPADFTIAPGEGSDYFRIDNPS